MKGPAVRLSAEQAAAVPAVPGDSRVPSLAAPGRGRDQRPFSRCDPGRRPAERMLGDLNGYASRVLSGRWSKPASGTWWIMFGSKRLLQGDAAVVAAVRYVQAQKSLAVWTCDEQ